eukprot:gnl/MRDRNA2_/MRDRNA2_105985_c0_seq1.p1 gnl/MRDRNA2_/MRDRNA2_105985_c0~~gnl/MRDRNA2_/MRDRNA2_105985_c0_seq1.p1  ORF type:complete len:1232 (-),score=248.08 gnl/MRDRNA2_/MRDRNA2_105985_c0_seq1:78-3773(-)
MQWRYLLPGSAAFMVFYAVFGERERPKACGIRRCDKSHGHAVVVQQSGLLARDAMPSRIKTLRELLPTLPAEAAEEDKAVTFRALLPVLQAEAAEEDEDANGQHRIPQIHQSDSQSKTSAEGTGGVIIGEQGSRYNIPWIHHFQNQTAAEEKGIVIEGEQWSKDTTEIRQPGLQTAAVEEGIFTKGEQRNKNTSLIHQSDLQIETAAEGMSSSCRRTHLIDHNDLGNHISLSVHSTELLETGLNSTQLSVHKRNFAADILNAPQRYASDVRVCMSIATPSVGAKCDTSDGRTYCCGSRPDLTVRHNFVAEVAANTQPNEAISAKRTKGNDTRSGMEVPSPSGFVESNGSSRFTTRFTSHTDTGFKTWASETTKAGIQAMSQVELHELSLSPLLALCHEAGYKIEDLFSWWAWAHPEHHDSSLRRYSSSSLLDLDSEAWDMEIEQEVNEDGAKPSRGDVFIEGYEETYSKLREARMLSEGRRWGKKSAEEKRKKEEDKKEKKQKKQKKKGETCEIVMGNENAKMTAQLTEMGDTISQFSAIKWEDVRYFTYREAIPRKLGNTWKRFKNWLSRCPDTPEELAEKEAERKNKWKGGKDTEEKEPELAKVPDFDGATEDSPKVLKQQEKAMLGEADKLEAVVHEDGTTAEQDERDAKDGMREMADGKEPTAEKVDESQKKACKSGRKKRSNFILRFLKWLMKMVQRLIVGILRAIGKLFSSAANMVEGVVVSPTPNLSIQGVGYVFFGILGGIEEVIDFTQRDITFWGYTGVNIGPSSAGMGGGIYNSVGWKGYFMNLSCGEAYSGPFVGGTLGIVTPLPLFSVNVLVGTCAVFDGKEFRSIPDTVLTAGLGVGASLSVEQLQVFGGMSYDVAMSYYVYLGGYCFRSWKNFHYLRYGLKSIKVAGALASVGASFLIQWGMYKINRWKVSYKDEMDIPEGDLHFDTHGDAPWRCTKGATIIDKDGNVEQTRFALATILYGAQDQERTLKGILKDTKNLRKTLIDEQKKRLKLDERNFKGRFFGKKYSDKEVKERFLHNKKAKKTDSEYARFWSSKDAKKLKKKLIRMLPKEFVSKDGEEFRCKTRYFSQHCTKHPKWDWYLKNPLPQVSKKNAESYDDLNVLKLLKLMEDWLTNLLTRVAAARVASVIQCGVPQGYCKDWKDCKNVLESIGAGEKPMSKHRHWAKKELQLVNDNITRLTADKEKLELVASGKITDAEAKEFVKKISSAPDPEKLKS